MQLLSTDRPPPPTALLADVRRSRTTSGVPHQQTLDGWGLRPLTGGRNNHVYSWTGPDGPLCIKIYKLDERHRAQREWRALTLLAQHGADYAPSPLWIDEASDQPALGMSLLPGRPLLDAEDTTVALTALAETTRAVQDIPLSGPLATWDRIDSAEHYVARLRDVWPAQLADHADDPHTGDMLALLRRWEDSGDADILAIPTRTVFSRGDANLLNWLHDGDTVRCVDFEYSGRSDVAFDAAADRAHQLPRHPRHHLARTGSRPRRRPPQQTTVRSSTANLRAALARRALETTPTT